MKINVNSIVKSYENEPVKDGDKDVTFKSVIFQALNLTIQDEKLSEDDKMKCYDLTSRMYARTEVEYSIEEAAFILNRIKKMFGPLVVGRANEFFNNKETK